MKKRLFVALVLPEEVKDALGEVSERISITRARWVPRENVHITIFFLGEVEERHVPEITKKLEAVARQTKPFLLRCTGIAYAPPRRAPTMVWAVFQESAEYTELATRTHDALRKFAARTETKELLAHITLARLEVSKETAPLPPEETEAEFEVNSFVLMESQGGPNGSRYTILETFLFF